MTVLKQLKNLQALRVEITADTARVTLERGEKNLLDAAMTAELTHVLHALDEDESIGAIVLTGAGNTFCGGADGPHIRTTGTAREFADAVVELFEFFPAARTPIIAEVNGDALAGGFGLVCSADIIVATETAVLGTIEATLGTWPAVAQAPVLRRVPVKAAITNVLTGDPFSAQRALELGVVDEVVPADQLPNRVTYYTEAVRRSGVAGQLGRPLMYRALNQDYRQALRSGADCFTQPFTS